MDRILVRLGPDPLSERASSALTRGNATEFANYVGDIAVYDPKTALAHARNGITAPNPAVRRAALSTTLRMVGGHIATDPGFSRGITFFDIFTANFAVLISPDSSRAQKNAAVNNAHYLLTEASSPGLKPEMRLTLLAAVADTRYLPDAISRQKTVDMMIGILEDPRLSGQLSPEGRLMGLAQTADCLGPYTSRGQTIIARIALELNKPETAGTVPLEHRIAAAQYANRCVIPGTKLAYLVEHQLHGLLDEARDAMRAMLPLSISRIPAPATVAS